jgi:hypothetical protein
MPNTPFSKSMMDLLSHISLPAADAPSQGNAAQIDPQTPLAEDLDGPHAIVDHLLAEVEEDLRQSRQQAARTALGLAGTRVSLDAARGVPPPKHVEWLAAHLRTAAAELVDGRPGKALKAVRLARLALR